MAKWKNGNGPALWPIDMSKISKVNFVAIPQTDILSTLAEAEMRRDSSRMPECPIHFRIDTAINDIINALCKNLGRRSPVSIECTKGKLNADVLRSVLERVLSTIQVPGARDLKGEPDREDIAKTVNEWGICYDDLSNSYIDVEYETIFGDTKVTILKYSPSSQPLIIEAKCDQCLVTRNDDGAIADIDEHELGDIEFEAGPFACTIKSTMVYTILVTRGGNIVKTGKITIPRSLGFVFGVEYPVFLEDGPKQNALPAQKIPTKFYLNNAEFSVVGPKGQLELNGIALDLGSMEDCKANIVRAFFKRKNSNLYKKIEPVDIYNIMKSKTEQWTEPGVSKKFESTVNAAKK